MPDLKTVPISDLIDMHALREQYGFVISLDYAKHDNNLFKEQIYRPDARLWLYKDLATIILKAASVAQNKYQCRLILFDGLRTVEAQEKMLTTRRAIENPHWLEPPRLLSPPGSGAHPRGMAIDVSLIDATGTQLDMGTPFDEMCENASAKHNPAHRKYALLPNEIQKNRAKLNDCIQSAAAEQKIQLTLLDEEWWDFRLAADFYSGFSPIKETDLPVDMRLCHTAS